MQSDVDTLIVKYTSSDYLCIDEDGTIKCLLPVALVATGSTLTIIVGAKSGCGVGATYFAGGKSPKIFAPFVYTGRVSLKEGQLKNISILSSGDRFYIDQKWLSSNVCIKMQNCTGSDYAVLGLRQTSKKITVQSDNGKTFSN